MATIVVTVQGAGRGKLSSEDRRRLALKAGQRWRKITDGQWFTVTVLELLGSGTHAYRDGRTEWFTDAVKLEFPNGKGWGLMEYRMLDLWYQRAPKGWEG